MYIGVGLKMVGEKLFSNIRKGVLCVFIVIMDGFFYDNVVEFFVVFRKVGVIILFVGLGKYYNKV